MLDRFLGLVMAGVFVHVHITCLQRQWLQHGNHDEQGQQVFHINKIQRLAYIGNETEARN